MWIKKQENYAQSAVVCIVGPTASGKSVLAENVFEFLGERAGGIINADARQVYGGLHTLTAAPELSPRNFLYEFLNVRDAYSFAQYRVDADAVIEKMRVENQVPIVVGGSGLYVDALLRRVALAPRVDKNIREFVNGLSVRERKKALQEKDPIAGGVVDMKNPRRVARALEVILQTGNSITAFKKIEPSPYKVLLVGWTQPREILRERISKRATTVWDAAVEEARALLVAGHIREEPGMKTIGVPEIISYLEGRASANEARAQIIAHTRQYARRQMTWFRRTSGLVWYNSIDEICRLAQNFLRKNSNQF